MARRLVGVAVLAVWFAGVACAAESPLALLPKRALALVMVNHLAETDAHVVALGKALRTPIPSMIAVLKAQAGASEGLDEKRSAMLVLVADPDSDVQPKTLLYLPVTDYDKLIKQLKPKPASDGFTQVRLWGSSFLAAKAGDYAVFAELEHDATLKDALASKGMPVELAPIQDFLAANDISAVGTRKGIETASSFVRTSLGNLRAFMGGDSDEQKMANAVMDVYIGLFETLDRETAAVAAGLNIDPSGQLRLTGRVRLTLSGQWADKVKTSQPPAQPLMAGLPQMPFAVAAGFSMSRDSGYLALLDELTKLGVNIMGVDDADSKAIVASSRDLMRQIQGMAMVLAASNDEGPLFRDMLSVLATDDAKRLLDAYEKQLAAQSKLFAKSKFPMKMEYQTERVRVAGLDALHVTSAMPHGPNAAMLEAMQIMDKMFGPGGKMVFHLVAIDAKRLLVVYCTTGEQLEKIVKIVRDGKTQLAEESSVAQTTTLLPKNAIATGYLSPQGAVVFANRVIKTILTMAPIGLQPLPEFPASPPVGAALTTLPGEIQFDIVVPRATTEAVGKYVEQMRPK